MRNIFAVFLLLFFWSCTSCNSSQNHDSDDLDHDSQDLPDLYDCDNESVDREDNSVDLDIQDKEVSDNDIDDEDDWPPKDDKELPDLEDDPYGTFYSDYDKNVAYKYYGDFDVIVQDPDEVRKLWDKKAGIKNMLECEPMPFDFCAENYPFEPQIIDGPDASRNEEYYEGSPQITYKCDALLTPGHWVTDNLSNQKIFHGRENQFIYHLYNVTGSWQSGGVYVYDIKTRRVIRVSRGLESYGMNSDSLFFSSYDESINILHEDSLYYGERFLYPLYYNFKEHKYGHMWKMSAFEKKIDYLVDLRASDTHVLMTAYFDEYGTDARIMYTKIGEWDKWKELTYKKSTLSGLDRRAGYGNMLGQYIVYYDYDLEIQFCDLDLGDAGCFRVSKDGEQARYPIFRNDENIVYYVVADKTDEHKRLIMKADITNRSDIKYSVVLERNSVAGMWFNQINEKFILFTERQFVGNVESKALQCYYRFSDQKTFCMDGDFDMTIAQEEGYNYKHMHIYVADEMIAVRDMECYCDYNPDKCPFEDYTPNPDNPKDPWK